MYTVIYTYQGYTFTEKRNGLCYAKMFAERYNGIVMRDGAIVWQKS